VHAGQLGRPLLTRAKGLPKRGSALTASGAFDDEADFARSRLIGRAAGRTAPYAHAQLWLDGGREDPFHAADETFAGELHIQTHMGAAPLRAPVGLLV
jgi:hypothetical protein